MHSCTKFVERQQPGVYTLHLRHLVEFPLNDGYGTRDEYKISSPH